MTTAPVELGEAPTWQPSRPWAQLQENLTEALRGLRGVRGDVDTFWSYHDGEHDQVWLNDGLRQAFGSKGMSDLQDNYCGMAVGAYLSRLDVKGWALRRQPAEDAPEEVQTAAKQAEAAAAAAWEANDLNLEQDDVYRAAFVAGECPVLVWPKVDPQTKQQTTDPDTGLPEWDVVAKDRRNCYVKAGPKLRSRLWAWVVWLDRDRWRATGYYSDQDGLPAEVVRLHTKPTANVSKNFPEQAQRFLLDTDDPGGPMPEQFDGKCPVVPFKLERSGRSWLRDAVPVQDKINKLAANKMVAAEFLAFPQRYALTDQEIPAGVLRYSPATFLQLDPGGGTSDTGEAIAPTSVGEFSAADLEIYDKAKSAEVDTLFTIKLLPRHLRVNPGTAPSGDAIKADEGPHVAYTRNVCMSLFGASWSDVQQLMGHDVVPVWEDPEVANALQEAQELDYLVRAGVPLLSALRKVGWTPEEIEAVGGELEALAAIRQREAQAQQLAQQQARPEADVQVDDGLAMDKRVVMAGVLIRSGYDPISVTTALDLPLGLVHTGALPTTVRTATEVGAEEQAKVEAVDGDVQTEPADEPPATDDQQED